MNAAKSIGPDARIKRTNRSRSDERSELPFWVTTGFERSRGGKEPSIRE
jgi:hypothetical protein